MRLIFWILLLLAPWSVYAQCTPGGVPSPFMWHRADNEVFGSPITGWNDQSGNGRYLNSGGSASPTLVNNGLNYNPLLRFNGTSNTFNRAGGIMPTSTTNHFYVYFVTRTRSTATDQFLYNENLAGANSPRIAAIVPQSNLLMYQDFGDNINGRLWVNWPGIGNTSDYFIWSLNTSTTISTPSGANKAIFRNGSIVSNSVAVTQALGNNSTFYLGSQNGSSNFFDGDLSEIIIYNTNLTTLQQRQIHSYLAVKYGITLSQGTPQDYIASNGTTVIWSALSGGSYNNFIAAIGRDNQSCLNQKQSVSWGDIATIGLGTVAGTNALNTNTFTSNFSFLSWGANSGSLDLQASEMPIGSLFTRRIGREWKAQNPGSISNVQVNFDLSSTTITGFNASNFGLFIDTDGDGDFTTGSVTSINAFRYTNSVVSFRNVTIPDQAVFTLAYRPALPAGISSTYFWIKADAGVTLSPGVSQWNDLSPNFRNITSSGANMPTLSPVALNFNPAVVFNGTNQFMQRSSGILGTSTQTSWYTYVVSRALSSSTGASLFYEVTNNTGSPRLGAHIPWNDGNIYYDVGNGNAGAGRVSATWGGNFNRYFLYSLNTSTNTSTPSGATKAIYRDGLLLNTASSVFSAVGNNQPFYLGSFDGTSQFYNGAIAELLMVNGALNMNDQKRIESYLAFKYAITLDQTTPTSYVASDGSTLMWNATTSGTFRFNIAGIGRDDGSLLNQTQSRANIITMGLGTIAGTNALNPNQFTNDLSFLSWASQNGALQMNTSNLPANPTIIRKLARQWKVTATQSFSDLALLIDLSTATVNGTAVQDFTLMIDTDGDGNFSTGTILYKNPDSYTSGVLSFSNLTLDPGVVFSVAEKRAGPAGIGANLRLWLRADLGIYQDVAGTIPAVQGGNIRYITDYSNSGNNAIRSGSIDASCNCTNFLTNFNPSIYFYNNTATSYNIDLSSIANSNYSIFGVHNRSSNNSENYLLGIQGNTNNQALHFGYRSATLLTLDQYGNGLDWAVPNNNSPYRPALIFGGLNTTSGQYIGEHRNGVLTYGFNASTGTIQPSAGQGVFGKGYGINGYLGDVTEIIVYNRALTANESQRVNSYLAIKNGITLSQSTPTDYLASTGTAIWSAATAGVYKNAIAVIGRDDASLLNQRISKSENTNETLVMGLGTIAGSNAAMPTAFGSDLTFLSWAHNNGSLNEQTTELPSNSSYLKRLGREWKIQETGTVSNVWVQFTSTITLSGTSANDYTIMVDQDGDGDFTTGTIAYYPCSSFSSNVLVFQNINFNDGEVFTIATQKQYPGGVASNLLWLKADAGIQGVASVTGWLDQSGNGNNVSATATSGPLWNNNGINFNPMVSFNGTSNYLRDVNGLFGTNTVTEMNVYVVSKTRSFSSASTMFIERTFGNANTRFIGLMPWTGASMIYDFGDFTTQGRIFAGWGGNTSDFFLWNLNTSTTTSTPSGFYKSMSRNGNIFATSNNLSNIIGNNSTFYFGADNNFSFYQGDIAEFILVNATVSSFQENQIRSYLGLKYGISLDQTTPTNYIASNGTTIMWNAATGGVYTNFIAGIGRDDVSGLNQKQSQGQNDILALGIGTIAGTNSLNPNSITSNLTFLTWGNDGGSITETSSNLPTQSSAIARLNRLWKAQTNGTFSSNQLNFTLSNATFTSKVAGDFMLMVDTDGDGNFSTGTVNYYPALSFTNSVVSFRNVPLTNGNVFTITTKMEAPGGVTNGLNLWLKSDAGVFSDIGGTVPATHGSGIRFWKDYSTYSNNAIRSGTTDPAFNYTSGLLNYNPTVFFNTNNTIAFNVNLTSIMGSEYSLFGSSLRNSTNNDNHFLGIQCALFNSCLHFGYRTPNIVTVDHFGQPVDVSVTWWNAPYAPSIINGVFSTTAGTSISEVRSGVFSSFTNVAYTTPLAVTSNQGVVGRGYNGFGFQGDLTEVIVYNRALSAIERQKVSSYLAIKNGVGFDQTTPTNYLSSTGTVIWNGSIVGNYKYDIAGIGRDDASGLNQKQSIAFNTGDLVSIGIGSVAGSNVLNPGSFTQDQSFMLWSNDRNSLGEQTTEIPSNSGVLVRLGREWKVQVTGTVPTVSVLVDFTSYTVSGANANDFTLIVDNDNDGDFTTGTQSYFAPSSYNSKLLLFQNVVLAQGNVFTIGTKRNTPGGISGTFLWLNASRGVVGTNTVTYWADQSGNGKDLTNGIGSSPILTSTGLNFNPTVSFDGTSDYMIRNAGILGTASYPDFNTYVVSKANSGAATNILFLETTNNAGGTPKFSLQLPTGPSPNRVEYDAGNGQSTGANPGRIAVNWGGNTSNYFLWTLNTSNTNSTPSGFNKAIYRNGQALATSTNNFTMVGGNNPFYFGTFTASVGSFNGFVAEVIMVNKLVTALEQKQLESYLALKYGISLNQATPTNYVASDGTTLMWNAATAGSYNNNITGIGRDDLSNLYQKQSRSSNSNEFLTMGLGTIAGSNTLNTNTIASNLSFLVWSDNNGSYAEQTTELPTALGVIKRIGKEWRISKTGTFGATQLNLDLNTLTLSGTSVDDFNLLIDTDGDGDFTTGTIHTIPATTLAGNKLTFSNLNFNNGDIFTFSTFKAAPGGVSSGLKLWLKANQGVYSNSAGTTIATEGSPVQYWYDFSLRQNHAIKAGSSDPTYRFNTNLINFNPTVNFTSSTTQFLNVDLSSTYLSDYSIFGNVVRSNLNADNFFIGIQGLSTNQALRLGYRRDTILSISQFNNTLERIVNTYNLPYVSPAIVFGSLNQLIGKTVVQFRQSGRIAGTDGNTNPIIGLGQGAIGRGFGSDGFLGDVTEIIYFNRVLTPDEIQRINSYLAIKTGITLSQSSPYNYLASNGTVVWSGTSYRSDITGIGRDDASGLNQKQSRSANIDDIVTIGIGSIASSNAANTNNFPADISYLVWANNNLALVEQTNEVPIITGCIKRLTREWKVRKTGTVSNCQLNMDISTITVSGTTKNDFNLLIDQDGDGDFTTGTVAFISASTLAGNVAIFDNVNFSDGDVFTFSTSSITSPSIGGIISSSSLLQCIGGNSGTLTLSGYNGSILNWESSTDNFATTTTISNTAFTNAFSNLTANTSFRVKVQNSFCPVTTSGVLTLTTVGVSVGGTVSGLPSVLCTGTNSTSLTVAGFNSSVLFWQKSTNGFASVTTLSGASILTDVNLTSTTGYRAVVSNSVCPAVTSTSFTVTVNGISVGGTVTGAPSVLCAGTNSTALTVAGVNGSVLYWQKSSDGFASVSTLSGSNILSDVNLTTSTGYRAVIANGVCPVVTSTSFTVTVNGISVGGTVTGAPSVLCAGTNSTALTVAGFNGSVLFWQKSTDGFASVSTLAGSNILSDVNLTTSTSYRAVIANGVCPAVTSTSFTVTVNGISVGGTVTGAPSVLCAGTNSTALTVAGFNGSVLFWQKSTDGFASVSTLAGSNILSDINLTTSTGYRAVIANGVCPAVTSTSFTVTVNGISVGGTVTGAPSVLCAGTNSTALTVAGFNGSVLFWQKSTDGFASVSTLAGSNILSDINLTTSTGYRAVVANGVCPAVTSTSFTVTVNGISVGGTVTGAPSVLCAGTNSTALTVAGFNGSLLFWQKSTDGFASVSTLVGSNILTDVNLTTSTGYRAVIANGVCPAVTSTSFTVTVNGISVGGTVTGAPSVLCAGTNSTSLTVAGFNGSVLFWQKSTNGFASVSTLSGSNILSDVNLTTSTGYRAVIANGVCPAVTSTSFTVTVNGISVGGTVTGAPSVLCAGTNSTALTVAGFNGSVLYWQKSTDGFASVSTLSGSNILSDVNLTTSTGYRAVIANGVCPAVTSTSFTVTVNGISVGGTVTGAPSVLCAGTNSTALTVAGFNGSILFWQKSTDGFASVSTLSGSNILSDVNLTTSTGYRAVIANGVCPAVTSTSFTVTVNGISVGGTVTGAPSVLCAGTNSTALTVAGFNGSVLFWQKSTDGFASVSTLAGSNILSDINLTTSTGYRAIIANGVCPAVTSTSFTVTVNGISVGGTVTGAPSILCSGTNSTALTVAGFNGSVLYWQKSTDGFASVSTLAGFNILSDVNLTTSTGYRAVIANGVCPAVTSTSFTVTVNGISVGGTVMGAPSVLCAGTNSTGLTVAGFNGSVLFWQKSTNGFSSVSTLAGSNILSDINLTTSTGYRAIIANGVCPAVTSTSFTVTVNGISVGGTTAGPASPVCTGGNAGTITVSGFTGSVIRWEYSTDNFLSIQTATGGTIYSFLNIVTTTGFRAVIQNGVCPTTLSGIYTATVNGISQGGTVSGANLALCSGSTANLTLTGFSGSLLYWERSTDGFLTSTTFAGSNLVSVANMTTTTSFKAAISSGSCALAYSTIYTQTIDGISVGGTIASGTGAVCSGNTLNLTATGYVGSVVGWAYSTDGFATSTSSAGTNFYTTPALTTSTGFVTIIKNGVCPSTTSGIFNTTVSSISIGGTVTSTSPTICAGGSSIVTLTGFNGSINTWESSSDNFTTITTLSGSNVLTTPTLTTSTSFRAIVSNGVCPATTSTSFTITVNGISIGGSVSGSPSTVCSGTNSTNLTLTGFNGNVLFWEKSTDGFISLTTVTGSNLLTELNLTTTTGYRAIVANGVCPAVTSSSFTVTVNGISVGGTVTGAPAVLCAGTNATSLTVAGFNGSVLLWQKSTDGFSTITTLGGTNILADINLSTTTGYRAVIASGVCPAVTSTSFTVTVDGTALPGTVVASTNAVCSGGSATITLSGASGSLLFWQASSDNFVTVSTLAGGNILSLAGLTTSAGYRAVLTGGACGTVTSPSAFVSVSGISIPGTVDGPTSSICNGSTANLTLTGFNGSVLYWETSTDAYVSVSTLVGGSLLSVPSLSTSTGYRAVIASGVCPAVTSTSFTVTVDGTALPGTVAASTNAVCSSGSATITLSGASGSLLFWQISSDNFVTVSTLAGGNILSLAGLTTSAGYRAVLTGGACGTVTSPSAFVSVSGISIPGTVDGPTSSICNGSTANLSLTGFNGSVLYWETSTDAFVSVSTLTGGSLLSVPSLSTSTGYRAVIASGVCPAVTSTSFTVTVDGTALPGMVTASTNAVCSGGSATITLSGASGSLLFWQVSSDNFVTVSTLASGNILSLAGLTTSAGYRAVLTGGACGTVTSPSAFVSVSGISIPGTVDGPTSSICNGSTANLSLTGFNGSVLYWETSTDAFVSVSTLAGGSLLSVPSLSTSTGYRAVIASGVCPAVTSTSFTVTVDGIALPGTVTASTNAVCSGGSATITLSGASGSLLFWQASSDNFVTVSTLAGSNILSLAGLTTSAGYRAVLTGGACGTVTSPSAFVSVSGISIPGTVDGPTSSICNGSTANLSLTGFNGSVLYWETSTDAFTSVSTLAGGSLLSVPSLSTSTGYRAVIASGVCPAVTSTSFTVTVDGTALPGTVAASTNAVCSGGSATITLSGASGSLLYWQASSDNFVTVSTLAGSNVLSLSGLTTSAGYRAVLTGGACGTVTSPSVTISLISSPLAGNISLSSATVCSGGNVTADLQNTTASVSGWLLSYDNFITSTLLNNQTYSLPLQNITANGSLMAVVTNGCITVSTSGVTISVTNGASGGTVLVPSQLNCFAGNAGTLTLSGYNGNITGWESSIDNFNTAVSLGQNTPTITYSNITTNTQYRANVAVAGCPSATSGIGYVTVELSNAGTVTGSNAPVCSGTNNGTLQLNGNLGNVIRWESTPNLSTLTNVSNTQNSLNWTNLTTTTYFRAVVQSNTCPETPSNWFTVTVSPLPKGGTLSGGATYGAGPNTGTITLSNYEGTIIRWEKSSDSLMTQTNVITNTSSALNYTNLVTSTYYRVVLNTPGCNSVYSSVVGIKLNELVIYTGFSPDGDGKNDEWIIENIHLYPNNSLRIFNRWGNLVYQESGYDNKNKVWKGQCNTGLVIGNQGLPEGTYYYILKIEGQPEMSGYLLLNR